MDPRRHTFNVINSEENTKRFSNTDKIQKKVEKDRASTLIKLKLTDDDDAQYEASLLSEENDTIPSLPSSKYIIKIIGTDLGVKKGKSFTVCFKFCLAVK